MEIRIHDRQWRSVWLDNNLGLPDNELCYVETNRDNYCFGIAQYGIDRGGFAKYRPIRKWWHIDYEYKKDPEIDVESGDDYLTEKDILKRIGNIDDSEYTVFNFDNTDTWPEDREVYICRKSESTALWPQYDYFIGICHQFQNIKISIGEHTLTTGDLFMPIFITREYKIL
jgi:hypothetical protein